MSTDQNKLIAHQARVSEVLDTATQPAQLFIGGLKVLFSALILMLVIMGYPIYRAVHGLPVSTSSITAAILCLAGLVLFWLTPYYVVLVGIGSLIGFGFWVNAHSEADLAAVPIQLWLSYFLGFGYAQWGLRKVLGRHGARREKFLAKRVVCSEFEPAGKRGLDSPAPDDLLQDLDRMLPTVADDLEAITEPDHEEQIDRSYLADIENMPLEQALSTMSNKLAKVREKVQERYCHIADSRNAKETAVHLRTILQLQAEADCTLSVMVARLERDAPSHLVGELHRVLAQLRATTAQIKETAANNGMIGPEGPCGTE